ncbi:hypothetical protein COV19_05250 [Candidatus Woesearchaeota archaeon CG10_big_fil_rev_8_21_14_0_10_44_13]|nr:MAG: hypothetical protein COV19_05250 [Candidatus Woesearchaeota archaeon CG10_big_fil_rev_8_21_14_0_10_44_13]
MNSDKNAQDFKPDTIFVKGEQGMEIITNFRQTSSCFKVYEIDPAIGCDFGCVYCSMYAQEKDMEHRPVKVFVNYPDYLARFISENKDKDLTFNFTPKSDALSPSLIETGVTQKILDVLTDNKNRFYMLTKSGIPRDDVAERLIKARELCQIIISSGLPNERYRALLEPNAPSISDRMELGKFCKENGIPISGIVAPYLPIASDLDADRYKEEVIERYAEAGIDHLSVHLLKLSLDCRDRMSRAIGGDNQGQHDLSRLYDPEKCKSIEWTLPGGKKILRYYPLEEVVKKDLTAMKRLAKEKGMTVSTCVEVMRLIGDMEFNDDAGNKGLTCVGFRR